MKQRSASLRVGLVDDDITMRDWLRAAVARDSRLRCCFAAATGRQAIDALSNEPLDVLLVDLNLPDLPGLDVIRGCRLLQPDCSVLVLTVFDDDDHMIDAFRAGARGYLLKSDLGSDLGRQIRTLRDGGSPLSPLMARRLLQLWSTTIGTAVEAPAQAPAPLTPKEQEVLGLIARGYRYEEIAQRLGITIATVRTHVRSLYHKLDAHNRTEAVFEARALGVLR